MDFRVGDYTYHQMTKIDALTQWDMIAIVSPLLATGVGKLVPILAQMRQQGITNIAEASMDQLSEVATPVARELARMSRADRHFLISTCLMTLERKKDGEAGWAKVWSVEAGRSMFDDINNDFSIMIRVALGVFQGTFQSFLPSGLLRSTATKPIDSRSLQ